ncbi:MAG: RNA-binding protein [Thaumarchaeota archaeon]|jgi:PUA domain protein|nr:RNA-binding protein [Nitrososphaerota archaeon]
MRSRSVPREEAEEIYNKLLKNWSRDILPKRFKGLLALELDDRRALLMLDDFKVVRVGDKFVPFLADTKRVEAFPYVTVDIGAVRFICNGADVMRPGVKSFPTSFKKGDVVVVKDEKYHKAVAVGEASVSSEEAQQLTKGPIIINIHYVGDKIWEMAKEKGII